MEGYAEKKVPGGKLVCAKVTYSSKIKKVEILGDFFLHPEEALQDIEAALVGADANSTDGELIATIKRVAEKGKIEMIGVTPESIAETIRMAIG